jgi:hypothetical protein
LGKSGDRRHFDSVRRFGVDRIAGEFISLKIKRVAL